MFSSLKCEMLLFCHRMRCSLLDLDDEDTLWEIFQECVSRSDSF